MAFKVTETVLEKGQSYLRIHRNCDAFDVYLQCEGTNSSVQLKICDIESALEYAVTHKFPVIIE